MVSVVEVRLRTAASAHHESTGIWAPSSLSPTLRISDTSDSMRAKLWIKAILPNVSVVRSAMSV